MAATIKDLLEAGCHFGHQTKRWNPKMKQYIFEARNGIHIIDLAKSAELLQEACEFLRKLTLKGGKILWVGTKKQAQEAIREAAASTQMYSVTERWVGGTLTNLVTIRRSVKRLLYIVGLETSGEMARMHKKEVSSMRREAARLHKNLDGIVNMEKQPAAMVVIDIKREENAIHEANRLGIPVVAILDTNCDPDRVQYPIPSNDDAIRAIKLIIHNLTEPVVESLVELGANLPAPAPAPATPAAVEATPAPEAPAASA